MAKKRLKIKDKQGNVVDYDISAASVTIDVEGKSLEVKLSELVDAISRSVKSVTFNGNSPTMDSNGNVNLGQQVQPDWSEGNINWPSFIRNKPSLSRVATTGSYNDLSNKPTIPEGVATDSQMSDTSDAPVKNKVIKAYVDNLISGLINGAPQALDTLKELSAALGNDANFAATIAQQLANKANSADVYTKSQTYSKSEVDAKGYLTNSKDNTTYKVWVGTQAELDALDDYEDNTIYLVGVPAVAPTRFDLTKSLTNVDASDETGATGAIGSQKVTQGKPYSIHLSPQTGYADMSVVVMMGNVDITTTAYDEQTGIVSIASVTGDVSITAVGNNNVPISEISSVNYAAGASLNTYQFSAVVVPTGGNYPTIVWSVVASTNGAATINASSGLLTITEDCTVVVTATSGDKSKSSSSIALTYEIDPNSPIVWEDANMEAFMLTKVTHQNNDYITVAEASNYVNDNFAAAEGTNSYQFDSIKNVVTKFNEWQYFPGLSKVNLTNFSALTEVTMPSTVIFALFSNANTSLIKGTNIKNVTIPEGVTSVYLSDITGSEIESINFPSTLETITWSTGGNSTDYPKLKVLDLSGTAITAVSTEKLNAAVMEIIKLPHTLESFGTASTGLQFARNMPNLKYIEIGDSTNGSSLEVFNNNNYNGPSYSLILHVTDPSQITSFSWSNQAVAAIYVPDNSVNSFKSDSNFSSFSAKIKGLSELPNGWDVPSSNS